MTPETHDIASWRRYALPLATLAGTALLMAAAKADVAHTNRDTELLAQSQADAPVVASLASNTRVDVLKRSGAWSQVKSDGGKTGWVKMFALSLESGSAGQGGAPAVAALLNGGRTGSTGTGTTGVKGLGEEDLRRAQANVAEFEKMQRLAVDKVSAQNYAQRAHLVKAHIEYWFDAPKQGRPTSGSEDY